jgi:DNA-binding MurR/RpiR family transcriptional regulator
MKMLYKEMGKAEKRIADTIIKDPSKIISLSIVELAELCGCSEASIVRFSKRLGLGGYQELKITIASELGASPISSSITDEDAPFAIYEKLCNDIYLSLEKTKKSLSPETLEDLCKVILASDRIVVFGLGNSASVAIDASHKFLRAGLQATAYTDNHMQMIAASHLTQKDIAIGISHSGSSKDIVEAVKLAHERGAATAAITGSAKSSLLKYTDYPLITSADETEYSILGLNSRIVQLAFIDVIYHYIVLNRSEKALEAIKETEHSLMSKKY